MLADYQLGSANWPGLAKFIEETSEGITIAAKLMAGGGANICPWEDRNLREELEDELAVIVATIQFLVNENNLNILRMIERTDNKLDLYEDWKNSS